MNVRAILLTGALAAGLASPAGATILTFDIDNTQPNSVILMNQGYGDRVTALVQGGATYGVGAEGFTPNVLLSYYGGTPAAGITRWTTDYGDLDNVLENEDDGDTLLGLTMTADTGVQAFLYGFDLAGYSHADYILPGLSIYDGDTLLFSQANVLVQGDGEGPQHTTFSFVTPYTGSNLRVLLDLTGLGGNSDNIGVDNVRFGQGLAATPAVPEPATWAMMIAGFGLVGGAMRRRSTKVAFAA